MSNSPERTLTVAEVGVEVKPTDKSLVRAWGETVAPAIAQLLGVEPTGFTWYYLENQAAFEIIMSPPAPEKVTE